MSTGLVLTGQTPQVWLLRSFSLFSALLLQWGTSDWSSVSLVTSWCVLPALINSLSNMDLYLCSGVLGIKVKIMLPWDPTGKIGPKKPLPDHVSIVEPKDEPLPTTPTSEQKGAKPDAPVMPQGGPPPPTA